MRKNLLSVIFAVLVLAGLSFAATLVVNTTAACASGSAYYGTIGLAVAAASDGDTVIVCKNGTAGYTTGTIAIANSINLFGNESGVGVQSAAGSDVFVLASPYINISNFSITGATSASAAGIDVDAASGGTNSSIYQNAFNNSYFGVYMVGDANHTDISGNTFYSFSFSAIRGGTGGTTPLYTVSISDNVFSGNGTGTAISLVGAGEDVVTNLTVARNNVTNYENGLSDIGSVNATYLDNRVHTCSFICFYLQGVTYANITGNTVYNSGGAGFDLFSGSNNNTLADNLAYNNTGAGFILFTSSSQNNMTRNVAENNTVYGFHVLSDSNNNTLTDNNASGNGNTGIILEGSHNNTLTGNTAYSNPAFAGIYLAYSWENRLSGNTAYYNPYGIALISAPYNNVTASRLFNNGLNGAYLENASYNTLTSNNASYNGAVGFSIGESEHDTLANNVAWNNALGGFYVYKQSSHNLTNNTAHDNGGAGFVLDQCTNNTLVNNSAYTNAVDGFSIYNNSANNSIARNDAHNNSNYGIFLWNSSYNNLTSNNAPYNGNAGFTLSDDSSYNNLSSNNASHNYADGFAAYDNSSFNNFTSNIAEYNGHYDATYAFNGFLFVHSDNNSLAGNTAYNNSDYGYFLNASANNTVTDSFVSGNGIGGAYLLQSDSNTFGFINAHNNSAYGFFLNTSNGNSILDSNASFGWDGFRLANCNYTAIMRSNAYNNTFIGFDLWLSSSNNLTQVNVSGARYDGFDLRDQSNNNTISYATVFGGTGPEFSIAWGFELYNNSYNVINNTNVSTFAIGAGLDYLTVNNTFSNFNSSNNAEFGIAMSSDPTVIINSALQENGLMDLMPDEGCIASTISNVTGSGGRPINYTDSPVAWSNFEASEILICNGNYSNITNATVHGSDALSNNALAIMNSYSVTVTNSSSSDNLVGFAAMGADLVNFTNVTALHNVQNGIIIVYSNNATISGSRAGNNDEDSPFDQIWGVSARNGIGLVNSANSSIFNNDVRNIRDSSAFAIYDGSGTLVFSNNTIRNATIGIDVGDASLAFSGDNYINDTPLNGSEIYVSGGWLRAMDYRIITNYLNYSIYADNISARSFNLSDSELRINGTNYNVSAPGSTRAKVVRTSGWYAALNVTNVSAHASMNVIMPYNTSDANDSDYSASNLGIGAYSGGQWGYFGRDALDDVNGTIRREGIASFSYFMPMLYLPAPQTFVPSSSSGGAKSLMLEETAFSCADGSLEISATSSGSGVPGLTLRLIRTADVSYVESQTDSNGKVVFAISADGDYEVYFITAHGYPTTRLGPFSLELCQAHPPVPTANASLNATAPFNQTAQQNQTTGQQNQTANQTGLTREDALAALQSAESAISDATAAGKDVSAAQGKLGDANDAFAAEDYAAATSLAKQAEELAKDAKLKTANQTTTPPANPLKQEWPGMALIATGAIMVLLVVAAIAAGAYYLTRKGRKRG